VLIIIKDLEIYAGRLPKKQLSKVVNWAKDNKKMLMENFKRLNPRL